MITRTAAVMAAAASLSITSRSMDFPDFQQIKKPTNKNIKVYPITKTRFKASFKDAFGRTHSVTGTYGSEDAARIAAWVAMKNKRF